MAVILTGTEYIEVDDSASVRTPSTALTVAFWWRPEATDSTTSFAAIIGKQLAGDVAPFASWEVTRRSSLRRYASLISLTAGGSFELTPSSQGLPQVAAEVWYFVTTTWTSGGDIVFTLYDDTFTVVETATDAGITGTIQYDTTPLWFGGTVNLNRFVIGRLAGVYVHDTELTTTQLEDLFNNTIGLTTDSGYTAPPITPSVGFWPLDYDGRDASGNGQDGTAVNSPSFTENPPRWFRGDGQALRPYLKTGGGLVELE